MPLLQAAPCTECHMSDKSSNLAQHVTDAGSNRPIREPALKGLSLLQVTVWLQELLGAALHRGSSSR
jgi:hypothetical protein